MSVSIPSDVYKIVNVAFPSQVADLINPGGADGTIGGYEDNSNSNRMLWYLNNGFDGNSDHFSLQNQEIATYAAILQDDVNKLVGNPDSPVAWSLHGTDMDDAYVIYTEVGGVNVIWTLPDGNDGTPITVESTNGYPQDNQKWRFQLAN